MTTPKPGDTLSLVLCRMARNSETADVLARVDRELHGRLDGEARSSVQIVLAEAINNVIEHGYPSNPDGTYRLRMRHGRHGVGLCLSDRGQAYLNGVPDWAAPDPASLSEGGYGWFLIRSLVQRVHYSRRDGTNRLFLYVAS